MKVRSYILKQAHRLIKKYGVSFSEAQKQAWKAFRIRQTMKTGKAKFTFLKKCGTIREAIGTLQVNYQFKTTTPSSVVPIVLKFYDVVKGAWRSASIINLV